jgi:hypothetical protein
LEEAIAALPRVLALDRKKVRQRFEQRFSAIRMAEDYVKIYRSLVKGNIERGELDVAQPAANLNTNSPRLLIA